MSELPPPLPGADLVRPSPPRSWREVLASFAESLDLSARRLAVGLVALAVVGVVAWRALAPAPPAAETDLPFATPGTDAAAPGASAAPGAAGAPGDAAAGAPGSPGAPGGTGPPADGEAASVPTEVVVHVAGAVVRPGVQRLPGGARVVDAVDRSGGATPDADLARVNLAAPVQDGQQVYVPRVGEVAAGGAPAPAGGGAGVPGGGDGGASDAAAGPVDLNSATAEELETLPGVGPATAQAILDHRATNGPFTSVDQLLDVRGIGDAKLEQLRDLVVAG